MSAYVHADHDLVVTLGSHLVWCILEQMTTTNQVVPSKRRPRVHGPDEESGTEEKGQAAEVMNPRKPRDKKMGR
jgi:hypothetical protein